MGLNFVAVGMVSALGLDWQTSCAAARCGISRAHGLQNYKLQAIDPGEVLPAQGHEAELLTRGFEGRARLLRLLCGALQDLKSNCQKISATDELPVYLSFPDPNRTKTNRALLLEPDGSDAGQKAEGEDSEEAANLRASDLPRSLQRSEELLGLAAKLAGWPSRIQLKAEDNAGAAGWIDLVRQCGEDLQHRGGRALICAADSLLDDETLVWLHKCGRLKNPSDATGLMPGEAAVAFLVDAGSAAASPMSVQATALARESDAMADGARSQGVTLAKMISKVAQGRDAASRQAATWILSGHNGETYNGHELGAALHHLRRIDPSFDQATISLPISSFGDVGCATPALSVATALAAWKRGYAPAEQCYVLAASDDGARSALALRNATGSSV